MIFVQEFLVETFSGFYTHNRFPLILRVFCQKNVYLFFTDSLLESLKEQDLKHSENKIKNKKIVFVDVRPESE